MYISPLEAGVRAALGRAFGKAFWDGKIGGNLRFVQGSRYLLSYLAEAIFY